MKKFVLVVLLLSAGLFAYAHEGHDAMKADAGSKEDMMAQHEKMMGDMKAMDAKLDEMVAAMNSASGDKKVEAMAALVTEIVSQRHKMQGMMMMSMHHGMMQGCGHEEGKMGCCSGHDDDDDKEDKDKD